jgi:hypothetical protein
MRKMMNSSEAGTPIAHSTMYPNTLHRAAEIHSIHTVDELNSMIPPLDERQALSVAFLRLTEGIDPMNARRQGAKSIRLGVPRSTLQRRLGLNTLRNVRTLL